MIYTHQVIYFGRYLFLFQVILFFYGFILLQVIDTLTIKCKNKNIKYFCFYFAFREMTTLFTRESPGLGEFLHREPKTVLFSNKST